MATYTKQTVLLSETRARRVTTSGQELGCGVMRRSSRAMG